MKIAMVKFMEQTCLLIQGVKGKFDEQDNLSDLETNQNLKRFLTDFNNLLHEHHRIINGRSLS